MRSRMAFYVLLSVLSAATAATALQCDSPCGKPPAVQDAFMDRLGGTWQATVEDGGLTFRVTMAFEWILNHQHGAMNYQLLDVDGHLCFSGRALVRPLGNGAYMGFWADEHGSMFAFYPRFEADTWIIEYREPTPMGETLVQRRWSFPDDVTLLEVVVQLQNGVWVETERTAFRKLP